MRAGYDCVRQPEPARGGGVCGVVRSYGNVAGFAVTCQHRRLCHLSAENQHHRHRRSGGPGRRLPQVHQRQPDPVPHERLACRDRADGDGKGNASAAHAIDHVRRLALQCPATRSNTPARRFRLRGCRGRRPASRRQHSLPRTIRPPPGEPIGRFGKCDHLGVAARRKFLPAGLHISRRLADGWDVDDNNAFQHCTLGTGRTGLTSPGTRRYDSRRLGQLSSGWVASEGLFDALAAERECLPPDCSTSRTITPPASRPERALSCTAGRAG
jgi:hypothetical protein